MTLSHEFVKVNSTSNEMGVDFTFAIKEKNRSTFLAGHALVFFIKI